VYRSRTTQSYNRNGAQRDLLSTVKTLLHYHSLSPGNTTPAGGFADDGERQSEGEEGKGQRAELGRTMRFSPRKRATKKTRLLVIAKKCRRRRKERETALGTERDRTRH